MNIDDLQPLSFTHDWNNSDPENGFTTTEDSEAKVRADIQMLHDETKNYINGPLRGALRGVNASAIPATNPEGETSTVQAELTALHSGIDDVQDNLDTDIANVRSEMQSVVLGQIPDGTITGAKIAGKTLMANLNEADVLRLISTEAESASAENMHLHYSEALGMVFLEGTIDIVPAATGQQTSSFGFSSYVPVFTGYSLGSVFTVDRSYSTVFLINALNEVRLVAAAENVSSQEVGNVRTIPVIGWYFCDGPAEEEATT